MPVQPRNTDITRQSRLQILMCILRNAYSAVHCATEETNRCHEADMRISIRVQRGRFVGRHGEAPKGALFHERKKSSQPSHMRVPFPSASRSASRRQESGCIVILVQGQTYIAKVILALDSAGGCSRRLYCWKEQADHYCDNANDHQQLNEGKSKATPPLS